MWPIKLPNLPFGRPVPPFSEVLRDQRTLRGVSIEELSEKTHLAPAALREMEEGVRPAPSADIAKSLADALSLTKSDRELFLDAAEWDSHQMGALLGRPSRAPGTQAPLNAAILVFLIADIRGYTHFTEQYGDRAAADLTTRFAAIAREVLDQAGGRFIEARGDEILAAFASAERALVAAQDLQAGCEAETRANPGRPLRIGIGLDLGEAVPVEGGGYRGAALNRAARLCSLAAPGEILVSGGVVYVAPAVAGVTYTLRGQEQLKGFDAPVPILLVASTATTVEGPRDTAGE
jgi:class 3 adenylate cyclase